jgi:hypothetical protein
MLQFLSQPEELEVNDRILIAMFCNKGTFVPYIFHHPTANNNIPTISSKTGVKLQQNSSKTASKSAANQRQNRGKTRTNLGPNRGKSGAKQGQNRGQIWGKHYRDCNLPFPMKLQAFS